MNRQNHESMALERFRAIALARSHEPFQTQRAGNRIPISGNVYYQFGDLRVELPEFTLLVEVESSGGGTTNLAKYWECYSNQRLPKPMKPIKLIHLFRHVSPNDYEAHMMVWRFISEKMHLELPSLFEAKLFKYDTRFPASLDPAVNQFESWLESATVPRVAV